jgi:transposase InsO family protein
VDPGLPILCRLARAPIVQHARDGRALASAGLALLLALEVPLSWRSSASQCKVRDPIAAVSRDNRLWGTERIRGELLKLGIGVSNRSIRRYRWRGPSRARTQTWRTFLRNHAHHRWASDLLSVPTLTFKTLHVLVFIAHGRRELVHVNVTANPTAAWVWRQLIEATPWGTKPRHLLRDRDAVYGHDFRALGASVSMLSVLTEFVRYYNQERPHRTLGSQTPQLKVRPTMGVVGSRPVMNGLHHVYERAALSTAEVLPAPLRAHRQTLASWW